jgi:hypothetical protein
MDEVFRCSEEVTMHESEMISLMGAECRVDIPESILALRYARGYALHC